MSNDDREVSLEALLAHQSFLNALALRLVGNEEGADELVQETWLATLQGPAPRGANLRGWLASVARNRLISRIRDERARAQRERRAARPEGREVDDAEHGLALRRSVIDAVRSLPEPYRTTIYLRYYEELRIADVAARMQVPAETARSRIQRGIELLRAKLDREFGSRGSWMVALGTWCRPAAELDPLAPSTPLAASAVSPLGWLALAGLASSALLAVLALMRWREPAAPPNAPSPGAARSPSVALATPEVGPQNAPRIPLDQPAGAAERARVAAATPATPSEESEAAAAPGSGHERIVYEVRGRVVGPDALPVGGVLINHGDYQAYSDEQGRFELPVVLERYHYEGQVIEAVGALTASREGYLAAILENPTAHFSGDPSALQSLELALGGAPRTLSGRVVTQGGEPALGWAVCLMNPTEGIAAHFPDRSTLESMNSGQPLTLEVDAAGRFELKGLLERSYDVIAWDTKTLQHVSARDIPASQSHIVLTAPDASAAQRVAGRVLSLSGKPLAGVRLRGLLPVFKEMNSRLAPHEVLGDPVETDELGHFEFQDVFIEPLTLFVESELALRGQMTYDVLRTGEDWEHLELRLPFRCEVVLDAQSLRPPSQMLAFISEDGGRHMVEISEEEARAFGGIPFWHAVFLGEGPGRRVVHTREDARFALFYDGDGTQIERRAIQLVPGTPLILSW